MGYKIFASINIAIIGNSNIAEMYALGFAMAGHSIFMAWKENERVKINSTLSLLDNIQVCSIEAAADVADLIIVATPPEDIREVSYWLGDVRRKVIIDATSNVYTRQNEPVTTACAIGAITGSQHIVKVFNTRGYQSLLKPLFKNEQPRLILVGDSKKAKEVAKILSRELEIKDCFDFGDSKCIPLFNEMTRCWRNLAGMKLIEYNTFDSSKS